MKIYEDHNLLVWNKTAGISVFPLHSDPSAPCVLYEIQRYNPLLQNISLKGFECGIAHRLDISTSGALYIAKNITYLQHLRELFREKELVKNYLFLSSESPKNILNCDLPIGHHPKNKRKMIVQKNKTYRCRGKWYPAHTSFHILGTYQNQTLYQAQMKSGVMHQIRVHASFCGIPLDGDFLYDSKTSSVLPTGFALHHRGIFYKNLPNIPFELPKNWPNWVHDIVL